MVIHLKTRDNINTKLLCAVQYLVRQHFNYIRRAFNMTRAANTNLNYHFILFLLYSFQKTLLPHVFPA